MKPALARAEQLARAGDLTGALALLEGLNRSDPFDANVLLSLSRVALRLNSPEAALTCANEAARLEPFATEPATLAAEALSRLGRDAEALALIEARMSAGADDRPLLLMRVNLLRAEGRAGEARHLLESHLPELMNSSAALGTLAELLFAEGEATKADELFRSAIKRAPKDSRLRFNHALVLLHKGDLARGWKAYEARLEIEERRIRRDFGMMKAPRRWPGGSLDGKGLLVFGEQGLGDQIMLAPLLAELAAGRPPFGKPLDVIADCEPRLKTLFERSFAGIRFRPYTAVTQGGRIAISYHDLDPASRIDYAIELASLPLHLRPDLASFPAMPAPLRPETSRADHFEAWLRGLASGPAIGICWRSGKAGGLRNTEYAPLALWADFLKDVPAELVLCQYGAESEEIAALERLSGRRLHVPPDLDQRTDLDGLAALLGELDAVVSAPTVVASLTAGLGIPVLKLTSAGSWTALGTSHEAFLPSAEIVRAPQPGDWPAAFAAAWTRLRAHLSSVGG